MRWLWEWDGGETYLVWEEEVIRWFGEIRGNTALCGLRNGTIVTVDARQRQRQLARHRIMYSSSNSKRRGQEKTKPYFVLRGDAQPSSTVYMSSSICCLASLQMYDQYFLASSMDGSIKLYDHRLTKRGPVQSYEGQVNSHSHIQLAADASERFLLSGEMLFEEKLSSSIPMSVCWQGNAGGEVQKNGGTHKVMAWLHGWGRPKDCFGCSFAYEGLFFFGSGSPNKVGTAAGFVQLMEDYMSYATKVFGQLGACWGRYRDEVGAIKAVGKANGTNWS
ncbi:DDB1- and CUL4-associated factor 4 [Bienertia sinuspersici]